MLIFSIIAIVAAVWIFSMYNKLVTLRNAVKNAFSQIDVQLKRRYDLVPNLVEVSKESMRHEKETLQAVIQARNQATSACAAAEVDPSNGKKLKQLLIAEQHLGQAMGRFMAVVESYPELKASASLNGLMEELSSTENKISYARQAFNDSVMHFNNYREMFPSVLVATMFGMESAQGFEIVAPQEREPVKVKFS